MKQPNGQWTDDQAAARFLPDNMHLAKNGPVTIPLPEGLPARLVHGDGTFGTPIPADGVTTFAGISLISGFGIRARFLGLHGRLERRCDNRPESSRGL
ncbi:hypothetical protein [Tahibacter harae]|uniref:Uncharacterized protein n=1 Tax=Tahibacter harae TaxID=2963937 RepID=A0ABT1QNY7_9GAMM|nr:hypothetical protein [Tahibacter harae]MCQ4163500.1 hypothetical protein [Tahibacter harae]